MPIIFNILCESESVYQEINIKPSPHVKVILGEGDINVETHENKNVVCFSYRTSIVSLHFFTKESIDNLIKRLQNMREDWK